jgi:hypothetical protein
MKNGIKIFAVSIMLLSASIVNAQTAEKQKAFTASDWFNLSKPQRVQSIQSFIDAAKKKGVTIKKSPVFYAKQVDAFYERNVSLKEQPVGNVLKTVMIMEYDWDVKGTNKDDLAKTWLGEDVYKKNKARLEAKKNK